MPKKLTYNDFVVRACDVHGDKYDYSKVEYVNYSTKVCIICPEHGEFWQRPSDHLNGSGCSRCSGVMLGDIETFTEKSCEIHNNKYDYSKVDYINNKTKVCIVCPEHGEFWQRPNDHLSGYGCPKCCRNIMLTTEEWVEEARKVHGDKYDYSKVEYKGAHEKVCIICPEHGEFWQTPQNHRHGSQCPKCASILTNSKMEYDIHLLLTEHNIRHERQKTFEWLRSKRQLSLDFYLPDYNIAIEVQGEQHFKSFKRFGGDKGLHDTIERDKKKLSLCKKHGVKLFYITKRKYNIDEVLNHIRRKDIKNE